MYCKLFLTLILTTLIPEIYACRHNIIPTNTAFTSLEVLLLIPVTLCLILLCFLLPNVAACFCEIREINAERRRRFHALRKVQGLNETQVHVPIHFLRNYYRQKRNGFKSAPSSEGTCSRKRVQSLI